MAISKQVAQDLCSKIEYKLYESSTASELKKLIPSQLKLKIGSCKKYLTKWKTLSLQQTKDLVAREKKGEKVPLAPIKRTKLKVQLFEEIQERFTSYLVKLEKAAKKPEKAKASTTPKKKTTVAKKVAKPVAKSAKPATKAAKSVAKPVAKAKKAPKVIAKKTIKEKDVAAAKKIQARNKTIASHQRSSNRRTQVKKDRR